MLLWLTVIKMHSSGEAESTKNLVINGLRYGGGVEVFDGYELHPLRE